MNATFGQRAGRYPYLSGDPSGYLSITPERIAGLTALGVMGLTGAYLLRRKARRSKSRKRRR